MVDIRRAYSGGVPLNPLHLKYFSDAVRAKSVSLAAEKNFVSQSAVSQAIRKLETWAGFPLVHHRKNSFIPTRAGELLAKKGSELFIKQQEVEAFARSIEQGESGLLHFGCMHSLALTLLPDVIESFHAKLPNVEISFVLADGGRLREEVLRGEIDFAIVLDNDDFSAFQRVSLFHGEYGVFEAQTTPDDASFLLSRHRPEALSFLKAYQTFYGKKPPLGMEVASWQVIANLAERGLGRAYIPDYIAFSRPELRRVHYPFPPVLYEMLAIFYPGDPLPPYYDLFLQTLSKTLQQFGSSPSKVHQQ